jgi:hypothetical protein
MIGGVLVIDPGHAGKGNACTAFQSATLVEAWFERVVPGGAPLIARPEWESRRGAFLEVVVERPAYQGQRSDEARPIDLINLSWSGAMLAGAFLGRDGARLTEYTPNDVRDKDCPFHGRKAAMSGRRFCTCSRGWKGSEHKPVHHKRLWGVLSKAERKVLGGPLTEKQIIAACEKGALDRWAKSGVKYYPKNFDMHNLLDSSALGCYHLGRLERVG